MQKRQVKKLEPGDRVFWTDPDDDTCSRRYTIQSISFVGEVIRITDTDGSNLECFRHELS